MKLISLFHYVPELLPKPLENCTIKNLCIDSRFAKAGDLFIAQRGNHIDSHNFISELLSQDIWVICDKNYADSLTNLPEKLIVVPDTTKILSPLSKAFFGSPDEDICIIGVTGTNGKTSVTTICHHILGKMGYMVGLIGTIHNMIGDTCLPAQNTTPNAFELYQLLHKMNKACCSIVLIEVSSHALALGRVDHLSLSMVALTNITSDHLDFHIHLEHYMQSKLKIFPLLRQSKKDHKMIFVNTQCNFLQEILGSIQKNNLPFKTFGVSCHGSQNNIKADWVAKIEAMTIKGTQFYLESDHTLVYTSLIGKFGIENLVLSMMILDELRVPFSEYRQELETLTITGRFQDIIPSLPYSIIIDYAHSPDALENVLQVARSLHPTKLITIFGCGGDRDTTKRPIMGQIAAHYSDLVIITSDNPRQEDPFKIIQEIKQGIPDAHHFKVKEIPNRYQAIEFGLQGSLDGSMVIIAGKGHENYQIFKNKTIFFSDYDAVKNITER